MPNVREHYYFLCVFVYSDCSSALQSANVSKSQINKGYQSWPTRLLHYVVLPCLCCIGDLWMYVFYIRMMNESRGDKTKYWCHLGPHSLKSFPRSRRRRKIFFWRKLHVEDFKFFKEFQSNAYKFCDHLGSIRVSSSNLFVFISSSDFLFLNGQKYYTSLY